MVQAQTTWQLIRCEVRWLHDVDKLKLWKKQSTTGPQEKNETGGILSKSM